MRDNGVKNPKAKGIGSNHNSFGLRANIFDHAPAGYKPLRVIPIWNGRTSGPKPSLINVLSW